MSRNTLYLSLLSIAVIGCTTVPPKRAEGNFDYLDVKEVKKLEIPSDLDVPNYSGTFDVSKNINNTGLLGKDLDIRSPALILPIAEASRIVLEDPTTTVWFDKVFEDRDLQTFIQYSLNEKLKSQGVSLKEVDENTYLSDWFSKDRVTEGFIYDTLDAIESARFKFTYDIKSHRRSLALRVDLIDYMKTDDDGGSKKIAPIDQKRAEVNMLNQIIRQVDYEYRLQQQKNRLAKNSQDFVLLSVNEEDEAAYVVEMEHSILWDSMPLFFTDYGFKITDLNEQDYIYFVDFSEPESDFWGSIWGEKSEAVDIEYAKYQFKVSRLDDERSAVTIYSENGEVLPTAILEKIYPVMNKGLSFNKLF